MSYIKYGIVIVVLALSLGCGLFYYQWKASVLENKLLKTQMELEQTKQNGATLQQAIIQMEQAKQETEKLREELIKIMDKWKSCSSYDEKVHMLEMLGKRKNILVPEG